jgi:hypothetical protein
MAPGLHQIVLKAEKQPVQVEWLEILMQNQGGT